MQFDWTTFVLEILNFLVLVWILKRFLYRPVLDVLDARQARVKSEMARAEGLLRDGEGLKLEYEERLAHWTQEREQLRQQLDQELAQQRAAGLDRVRQSLADEEAKSKVRKAAMTSAYEAELIRRAASGAYGNAAAMLQRLASPALTESIANLLLEDLASLPDEQLQALREAAQKAGAGGSASAAAPPGPVIAEIAAAHALSDSRAEAIARGLSAVSGVSIKTTLRIDPSLIAGVRIAVGECLLHGNLADELAFFRRQDGNA